jgi:hypothetical protein
MRYGEEEGEESELNFGLRLSLNLLERHREGVR